MAVLKAFDFGAVKRQPRKPEFKELPLLSQEQMQSYLDRDQWMPVWQLQSVSKQLAFGRWIVKFHLTHIQALQYQGWTSVIATTFKGITKFKVIAWHGEEREMSVRAFAEYGPRKFGEVLYQRIIQEVKA